MSAEKLFDENPKLYFWTFTFTEVWHDFVYSRQWGRFWRDFTNHSNFFIGGLKVTELHKEHGIHFHCILNKRLPVDEIRRIGRKYGIGRVHVRKAKPSDASYLAKYLSKDFNGGLSKYIRRWKCVGSFVGVRNKDVVIESDFTRAFHAVSQSRRVSFTGYQMARSEFVKTGRVSPQTIFNNLHRPKLALYERMLVDRIVLQQEEEEEDGPMRLSVIRYFFEPKRGTNQFQIVPVESAGQGHEQRGNPCGFTATQKQAGMVCDFLNGRLKKKSYNA